MYVSDIGIPSFSGEGDIRFSLNGTTYENNSIVMLEDIGEGGNALDCLTDLTACCRPPYTNSVRSAMGNWFFPNGTRVPSSGQRWDIHRTRGHMKVLMQRRRGGVTGVYHCVIPDALNVIQTIYIGIYTATCEWYMHTPDVHKCAGPYTFFSLGVLTFTTYHKQLCAVRFVLHPSNTNAKNWGCFSTPKHPLVYGLDVKALFPGPAKLSITCT